MTNTQRWVIVGAGALVVAGLVGAAIVSGLQGVEVMSWLAGSASLLVAVVALVVAWPAQGRTTQSAAPAAPEPTPVTATAQDAQVRESTTQVPGGPTQEQEQVQGGSADAETAVTGPVRQHNTGGVNIANSGTIGSIDISQ